MQKTSPFLGFNETAEQAVNFDKTVFPGTRIGKILRASAADPGREGQVRAIGFELFGQHFTALNYPSNCKFTKAVSFVVDCRDQAEVDYSVDCYRDCLSEGKEPRDCGWGRAKFGVFRQIPPTRLIDLMTDPNPNVAARAAAAMMTMQKIDIETLERAVFAA
jgi:predicted 3-demethylubiquinone-9 3-methyltransferase (glyoxalase superfamily)